MNRIQRAIETGSACGRTISLEDVSFREHTALTQLAHDQLTTRISAPHGVTIRKVVYVGGGTAAPAWTICASDTRESNPSPDHPVLVAWRLGAPYRDIPPYLTQDEARSPSVLLVMRLLAITAHRLYSTVSSGVQRDMEDPHIGDLVYHTGSVINGVARHCAELEDRPSVLHPVGTRDVGYLLLITQEPVMRPEKWREQDDRPVPMWPIHYVQTFDGQVVRYENAEFFRVPIPIPPTGLVQNTLPTGSHWCVDSSVVREEDGGYFTGRRGR